MQAQSQQSPVPHGTVSVPITPRMSPAFGSSSPSSSPSLLGGSQGSASSDPNIDLLFAHSSARIVSFDAAAASSSATAGQLIPWNSPTERTIASGPVRIYRTLPHNIAFLQSGSALRPVLSKSQCWNVDGRGVFCLQIRPGSFWRLEILENPGEEAVKAIEFKGVLVTILAYEITTCPFLRSGGCVTEQYVVGVLEPSRVWKRPRAATIDVETVKEEPEVEGQSAKEIEAGQEVTIEDQEQETCGSESDTTTLVQDDEMMDQSVSSIDSVTWETSKEVSLESREWHDFSLPLQSPRGNMLVSRSCTAPPQLTDTNAFSTISRPSSRPSTPSGGVCTSPIKWHTPTPQSREVRVAKRRDRNLSSVGLEVSATLAPESAQISSALSTPTLWSGSESEDSWLEIATTQRPSLYRGTDSAIAPHSPTLSRSVSSLMLSKTTGFIGATANFVVVRPSSYIASMMFSIASRIATRAVTGAAYTLAEKCGPADLDSEEFDYEDDFGVRLRPGRKDPWDKDVWGPENV